MKSGKQIPRVLWLPLMVFGVYFLCDLSYAHIVKEQAWAWPTLMKGCAMVIAGACLYARE